jgi:hypothetical protein
VVSAPVRQHGRHVHRKSVINITGGQYENTSKNLFYHYNSHIVAVCVLADGARRDGE